MGTELRRIWLVPILIANTEGLVCRVWDQNPKDTLVCGYVCKNPLLSTLRPPKCLCVKGLGHPNNQFEVSMSQSAEGGGTKQRNKKPAINKTNKKTNKQNKQNETKQTKFIMSYMGAGVGKQH